MKRKQSLAAYNERVKLVAKTVNLIAIALMVLAIWPSLFPHAETGLVRVGLAAGGLILFFVAYLILGFLMIDR